MESKFINITGNRLLKIDYFFDTEIDRPRLWELYEEHGEEHLVPATGRVLNSYLYHSTATPELIKDEAGQSIFLNHYDLMQIAKAVQEIENMRCERPVGNFIDV